MFRGVALLVFIGCLGLAGCFPGNCAPIEKLGYVCPTTTGKVARVP